MATESMHTPGPWAIDSVEPDTIVPAADTELSICVVSCVDEGSAKGWHRGDVTRANARLIAAAPQLLDACLLFARWAQAGQNFQYPPGSLQQLTEAITNATAESTHE